MKCLAVLPVRLDSTRLAKKALLRETGKYLFQHTFEGAREAKKVDRVAVATDNQEIQKAAESFGAQVIWTSSKHTTGTDRVQEASRSFPEAEYILNIQGDYPEIRWEDVDRLAETLMHSGADSATLATEFRPEENPENPNLVKVVFNHKGTALYFSRSPIPHPFREKNPLVFRHVGIYGFRRKTLEAFTRLEPTRLEKAEGLEQLRLLENGYSMAVALTDSPAHGIENPQDYSDFVQRWKQKRS